jgi:hypothetical protein
MKLDCSAISQDQKMRQGNPYLQGLSNLAKFLQIAQQGASTITTKWLIGGLWIPDISSGNAARQLACRSRFAVIANAKGCSVCNAVGLLSRAEALSAASSMQGDAPAQQNPQSLTQSDITDVQQMLIDNTKVLTKLQEVLRKDNRDIAIMVEAQHNDGLALMVTWHSATVVRSTLYLCSCYPAFSAQYYERAFSEHYLNRSEASSNWQLINKVYIVQFQGAADFHSVRHNMTSSQQTDLGTNRSLTSCLYSRWSLQPASQKS